MTALTMKHNKIFISCILLTILLTSCSTVQNNRVITKRVLFAGDSITEGELGRSYLELLRPQFPDWEMVNLGQDGDTVSGIMRRTVEHLSVDSNYDLILISAGHNDIILPDFNLKTDMHRMIVDTMKKKGSTPAVDYNEFISTYTDFIDSVQDLTTVPIVLISLSCLNEDLSVSTNKKRAEYNQGISALADDYGLILADVGAVFDSRLSNLECNDYFMDDLMHSAFFGRRDSKTDEKADRLSKERSLHLTIDGIHLNSEGADIYSQVLAEVLNNL